jgi:hypothetical protein
MKPFAEIKHNLLEAIESEQGQLPPWKVAGFVLLNCLYWDILDEVTFDGMIGTLKKFLAIYKGETILDAFLP